MTLHQASESPRHPDRRAPFGGAWLVTFTDLAAIMLAFFILQYSMTEIEAEKWDQAKMAFNHFYKKPVEEAAPGLLAAPDAGTIEPQPGLDLDYLASILDVQIEETPALADATLEVLADRIVIALPDTLLFAEDGADLRAGAEQALAALAGALASVPNRLDVIGHTDPTQPGDAARQSNWELSLERALTASRALRAAGYTRPVRTLGRASGDFARLNPALPLALRRRLAQRVDLVVRDDRAPQ